MSRQKPKYAAALSWAAMQAQRAQSPGPAMPLPFTAEELSWRAQHGDKIERVKKTDVGVTDEIGDTYRIVDTIAALVRSSRYSDEMIQAARMFKDDFDAAHLYALHAADYARAVVDCRPTIDHPGAVYSAGNRVWSALTAVGGLRSSSRQGSVLWHVIGLGDSLTQWAIEQQAGRPLDKRTAAGILMGALETLVEFYGIKKTS